MFKHSLNNHTFINHLGYEDELINDITHYIASMDYKTVWESEYSQKSKLWTGSAVKLPDLPKGTEVLELGCGNGKTLAAMVKKEWHITAVDISSTAILLARKAIVDRYEHVKLMEADIMSLPLEPSNFDAVFCYHVLGHLVSKDREKALNEVKRVLKPGGKLFIQEFSMNDLRFGKGEEIEPNAFLNQNGILTTFFSEGTMFQMLEQVFPGSDIEISTGSWRMTRGRGLERERIDAVVETQ